MHLASHFTNLLFAPGNRLDRVEKAHVSVADVVCIDLEDSVPVEDKDSARDGVMGFLKTSMTAGTAVRINGMRTAYGVIDLAALAGLARRPSLVMVPMVESPTEIEVVHAALADDNVRIVPLLESAKGIANAAAIGRAPGVEAMMFGGGDLSAQLGVDLAWDPLLVARSQFVLACAQAGVRPIDVPCLAVKDTEALELDCNRARDLGFSGKAAIHPAQLDTIATTFRPTEEQVEKAKAAVEFFNQAGRRAVAFQGMMLDEPIVKRFEALIANAREESL